MLPPRGQHDEDAWIQALQDADDDHVAACVRAAVRAGRPGLAARAVGLLSDDVDDPDILRAQSAARLLCLTPPKAQWVELDDALTALRKRRLARFKARHRKRIEPSGGLLGSGKPRSRKPRR